MDISLPVTTLYAGILGIIFIALGIMVGKQRVGNQIFLGDGGNDAVLKAVRVHGNFAEWVPLALILLALCELNGAPALWIHIAGIVLVVSRILHAIGLGKKEGQSGPGRPIGAFGTMLVLLATSGYAIYLTLVA